MAIRIITSIVGIPILIFFVILGGAWLKAALLIVSLIGMYEFYMAVSKKLTIAHLFGFLMEIVYIFLIENTNIIYMHIAIIVVALLMLSTLVFLYGKINIHDVAISAFGFLYVGFLISHIILIRNIDSMGIVIVWLPFICAWGSDTGAYFVGSTIGKRKLAPVLSPHKSVEGAIGGVVTAAILAGIYGYVAYLLQYTDYNMTVACVVFGAIGSIFSQIGDLAASSVKRYTKIKDYGKIMPGHGGVLDRFDSVIFTTPIIYILTIILVNI